MGSKRLTSSGSSATIDRAIDLAKIGDSLYVADSQQCIWIMDNQGRWIRRVGQAGNGPGEFGALAGIDGNSKYIFTFDRNNARIQVYDHQFNLLTSFNHAAITGNGNIAVSDSAIYVLADYKMVIV